MWSRVICTVSILSLLCFLNLITFTKGIPPPTCMVLSTVLANQSDSAMVDCQLNSDDVTNTYNWNFNSATVSTSNLLQLMNVTSSDGGLYVCSVMDQSGTALECREVTVIGE